jgi:hypothetical protein
MLLVYVTLYHWKLAKLNVESWHSTRAVTTSEKPKQCESCKLVKNGFVVFCSVYFLVVCCTVSLEHYANGGLSGRMFLWPGSTWKFCNHLFFKLQVVGWWGVAAREFSRGPSQVQGKVFQGQGD